jgi:hypothetical protein
MATLKELIEAQTVQGLGEEDIKSMSYDVEKAPPTGLMKMIQDYGITPGSAALDLGIGALTGAPLIGSALRGIGNMFTPNPSDIMSQQFNVSNVGDIYGYRGQGLGSPGLSNQDPFGINTVSMFGNYPGYAAQTVQNLLSKQNLNPFQTNQLGFYQDVVNANNNRIDKDFPGGTNFDFTDYEQDTGGNVGNGGGGGGGGYSQSSVDAGVQSAEDDR